MNISVPDYYFCYACRALMSSDEWGVSPVCKRCAMIETQLYIMLAHINKILRLVPHSIVPRMYERRIVPKKLERLVQNYDVLIRLLYNVIADL